MSIPILQDPRVAQQQAAFQQLQEGVVGFFKQKEEEEKGEQVAKLAQELGVISQDVDPSLLKGLPLDFLQSMIDPKSIASAQNIVNSNSSIKDKTS